MIFQILCTVSAHISVDQSTQLLSAFAVAATVVYSAATRTTKMENTLALHMTILMKKKFHRTTFPLSLWRRYSRYRSSGKHSSLDHIITLHHTAGKRCTCFPLPRTRWWRNNQKQYHATIPRVITINQLLNEDWLLMNSHQLPQSLSLLPRKQDIWDWDLRSLAHSPKFHNCQ